MAVSKPVNLRQVTQVVEDRESLILWLMGKGLLANQPVCPSGCGCNLRMVKDKCIDGVIWRCPRKACRKKVSLRHNSFFAGSHLTLRQIILIVYYWARDSKLSETSHVENTFCQGQLIYQMNGELIAGFRSMDLSMAVLTIL